MIATLEFALILIIVCGATDLICRTNENDEFSFMGYTYTYVLKGIATLMIVFSHVSGLTGTRAATPLGGVGVAVLLLCSGYGTYVSYRKKGLDDFWKVKFKRIIVPYWMAIVLFYFVNWKWPTNVLSLVKQVLLLAPLPYMWYVQYVLILLLLFYVIHRFIKSKARNPIMILICMLSIILLNNDLYAEQSFSFVTGVIIAQLLEKKELDRKKRLFKGVFLVATGVAFLAIKQVPAVRNASFIIFNVVQMLIKLPFALGLTFCLDSFLKNRHRGFVRIGRYSYELYIVHTILICLLVTCGISIFSMVLYIMICVLMVIIFSKTEAFLLKTMGKVI